MLTLLKTWQLGDISRVKAVGPSLQGDLTGVLSSITAKGLIMPCKTDLYFPVSSVSHPCIDNMIKVAHYNSRKTVRTKFSR